MATRAGPRKGVQLGDARSKAARSGTGRALVPGKFARLERGCHGFRFVQSLIRIAGEPIRPYLRAKEVRPLELGEGLAALFVSALLTHLARKAPEWIVLQRADAKRQIIRSFHRAGVILQEHPIAFLHF